MLGPVQILKKEESESEAIQSEISLTHEEEGGIKMEECSVEGHEHPPLPALTITYSNDNITRV